MGVATGDDVVSTIVSISPTVPAGSYDLVVVANGNPSDPVPVTIAAALPAISASLQDGGAFGIVCDTAYLTLQVYNVGGLDLIVDQVQALPAGGDFTVLPAPSVPVTISPGDQIGFTVRFAPNTPATAEAATIRITSNNPVTPILDLEVTASAGDGQLSTVIAGQGDFGEVCPDSFRDQPITLCKSATRSRPSCILDRT